MLFWGATFLVRQVYYHNSIAW